MDSLKLFHILNLQSMFKNVVNIAVEIVWIIPNDAVDVHADCLLC